ncbi:precorrin-4 C(11)-methyltransferase [Halorhodospira halochloris]|uniref:precorrin-4 C(11)-methyltransferase n=1 Tax=Halorhodospira halochloris TaxID=1052 RepID=UPI001EE784F7|nr:precorrin-4 C(11)-methyltransferase [Halorhodospira halochloris]MCG5529870.1 precorrin-4 C(11)-methyltransferase [Halorhodospira halochloris]
MSELQPPTGGVWFVGAGPGAADLITVRGRDCVAAADAILYAGSLVSPDLLSWAQPGCELADSKGMDLEQLRAWLLERATQGLTVVRLQPGDPSLYGALPEIAQPLDEAGVPVHIVPGVTSAMAAAAAAGECLTLPESTQTVIFTRVEGMTAVPSSERLSELAKHGSTLCIYLSATLLDKLSAEMLAAGRGDSDPIVVVHKASWPGAESILRTDIANLADDCYKAGITTQAMIIAGPTIGARTRSDKAESRLYDQNFSHGFRQARDSS